MAIEKVYKLTIEGTDSVNELKDAIEQLNEKLKTLNETSQEYKDTLEELTKLQAQLAEAMEDISESTESTSESMESIKDSIADVGEVISDVSDSLDNLGDFDSGAIDAFVEGFVDGLNDAINSVDGIEEKLDEIQDVDVNVNVDVDGGSIEALNDALDNIEDADVKVNVDVNQDSIDQLKETLDGLEDTTVSVNVTTDEGSVEDLKETLENIEDVNVTVGVEVDDSSLDNLTTTLENVEDVNINVGVEVSDEQLDSLSEDITNITTDFESLNSEAEKTSETLGNIGGASTVKELKQQISDLRDRLVTLDKGSEEYKATVQQLIDDQVKLKEVMNAGKNEIQAAEGSYNALSQRMSALKQVWKETTDEATRDEIGKQINEINNQLKALDSSIGNSQRNVGNYKSALEGLDAEYITQKQELKELKIAMEQMDPATQEYADAMARAAELTHNLSDQQEMIKYSSADVGDQLSNVRGIASNLAAGYSAVNAAMGLFGGENEEVAQALLKVQQAMALVQGLQGIDGFIKRTKGLSQSMGLVTKATQANTVATKANAAASKADAVAKGAEAVATKAAVPAQLSLNAAMKANPIGFIVGLIATLVTAMMLLKDKIMEMIGANEGMSKAFDKVKAVLAGFGNVIKKSVINPVKMAIIPIKTLAKVMIDLFKGDWSKIGDDFKAGMEEMKDTAIDTINVVGAFKEGYDKKRAEQEEAYRKAAAAEREKDLNNQIKDNEAKYGSDWKYTEDAQKLYQEMFKARMEQYAEDSDEYREAQRDKMAYDRELSEHQKQEEEQRNAASKKAAEDAAKARKKRMEDNLKAMEKAYSNFSGKFIQYADEWDKIIIDIIDTNTDMRDRITATFNDGNGEVVKSMSELKKYFIDELGMLPTEAEESIQKMVEALENGLNTVSRQINGKNVKFFLVDQFKWYLQEIYNFSDEKVDEILTNIKAKINTLQFEKMAKTKLDAIEKDFYNFDRTIKQQLEELNTAFEKKLVISGITFPQDEIDHFQQSYQIAMKNIIQETDRVDEEIYEFSQTIKDSLHINVDDEELGRMFPSFQKLLDKRNELEAAANRLELSAFRQFADIQMEVYERQNKAIEDRYARELNLMQFNFDQENLLQDKRSQWYQGNNVIEQLQRQKDFQREYYAEVIKMYQEQMRQYKLMSEDMTLTDEQRRNALAEFERLRFETEKALQDQQKDDLKTTRDIYKEWTNVVKNSISDIGDIMSSLANSWSSLINLEKEAIETELENGDIREDEAKRREEANKEAFNKLKTFQIVTTIINTIAGSIGAFLQASSAYPPPWGQILGGVSAAAVAAAGYAEVKQIQATEYGDSSIGKSSAGSSSTSFQLPDVMATEPDLRQNLTGMDDTDSLNNAGGNGNGKGGETAIKAYVVESDVSASQELARKRNQEVTF